MSPKCPDAPAATDALTLTTETIKPGTSLYRFHGYDPKTGRYSGDAFNPYASPGLDWTIAADGARFSPFPLPGEAPGYVPGIYAAADHQSAVFESLFHDIEHRPGVDVYWDDLVRRGWHFTQLEVLHPIEVTPIATPNLRRLEVPHRSTSLTVAELVHSQRDSYPQTRAWARRIHAGVPASQGLRYASRLGDGVAYVLYGGRRWTAGAIAATEVPIPIDNAAVKAFVKKAATLADIRLLF